jgi:hypothetical protein
MIVIFEPKPCQDIIREGGRGGKVSLKIDAMNCNCLAFRDINQGLEFCVQCTKQSVSEAPEEK